MTESTDTAPEPDDDNQLGSGVAGDAAEAIGTSLTGMRQILDRLNEGEARKQSYSAAVSEAQYAADLRRAFANYRRDEEFKPGDLVQWKPMLRNRPYPAEGAPAVVVRHLKPAAVTDGIEQSEDLDIELGFLDGEQSFLVFSYSSARFTRWTE
ncbi:hypothetical protein [Curtobacterium sp. MCBA15_013]|uniref:hypothetical protein n=1 Tax=Curtobacterium sp. MCBA15_013 TaxID=1898739 RepID=UPI0008DCAF62|nr:hypothetical protein [Curtobacterium sp. MCBA15_013]OII21861.1 hypothetical protein BIV01_17720 [Curtobacterium sp. MCBA15_013]